MTPFENLIDKWSRVFKKLDVNQDGILSRDDLYQLSQIFIDKYHLTGHLMMKIKFGAFMFADILQDCFGDEKDLVNLSEALDATSLAFVRNAAVFEDRIKSYYSAVFDVLDLDHDGTISKSEYRFYYERLGKAKEQADDAFRMLDVNSDGLISRDEMISAYIKYYCDPLITAGDLPLF